MLKALKEKAMPLGNKKSATFFKITDLMNELQGPSLIKYFELILPDELEIESS